MDAELDEVHEVADLAADLASKAHVLEVDESEIREPVQRVGYGCVVNIRADAPSVAGRAFTAQVEGREVGQIANSSRDGAVEPVGFEHDATHAPISVAGHTVPCSLSGSWLRACSHAV